MGKIVKFSNFRLKESMESSEESNKYYNRFLEVYELMKDYFLGLRDEGWYGVDNVIISRRGIWNNKEMQNKVSDLASIFSTPGVYDTSYMSEYPKLSSNLWNQKYGIEYFKRNSFKTDKSGFIIDGVITYTNNVDNSSDDILRGDIESVLDYLVRLSYHCKKIKFDIYNNRGFLTVRFSGVIKEG